MPEEEPWARSQEYCTIITLLYRVPLYRTPFPKEFTLDSGFHCFTCEYLFDDFFWGEGVRL